jgi:hypothetical protein
VKVKRDTKSLDINIHHTLALNGRDRHKILVIREVLHQLYVQYTTHIGNNNLVAAAVTRIFIAAAMTRYRNVSTVEITHPICYGGDRYRFNSPLLQPGMIAATYRFKNVAQLRQLRECLQLPEWFINPHDRCRFNCEELLLIVLEPCALGTRLIVCKINIIGIMHLSERR